MAVVTRAIIDGERDGFHAVVEPKDAATLIVIDRSSAEPKVLLGRRNTRHVFMPGKFVFPGGRVDPSDRTMPIAKPLQIDVARKLLVGTKMQAETDAQAIALAAIRETFEEAGLVIGASSPASGNVSSGTWAAFTQTGHYPDASVLRFVARAITPPGFPRRFDAQFFCADAEAIVHRVENVIRPDAELVELAWLPIDEARKLNLPVITELVLQELQSWLQAGATPDAPVPFYCTRDGEFTCELIT